MTSYIFYTNLNIGKKYCVELKQKINENPLYDVQIADIQEQISRNNKTNLVIKERINSPLLPTDEAAKQKVLK